MSEKATCPKCGSFASEAFYEERHRHCGWNCHVERSLRMSAVVLHGAVEFEISGLTVAPDDVELQAVVEGVRRACSGVGATIDYESTELVVLVDGEPPHELSPWFGPRAPVPETPALAVACPVCHVPPSFSCIDLRAEYHGRQLKRPHGARAFPALSAQRDQGERAS